MRSNTSLPYQLVSKILSNFACIAHRLIVITLLVAFLVSKVMFIASIHLDITLTSISSTTHTHTHTHTQLIPNIFIQNQMNCVRALAVGLRINTDCSMQQSMVSFTTSKSTPKIQIHGNSIYTQTPQICIQVLSESSFWHCTYPHSPSQYGSSTSSWLHTLLSTLKIPFMCFTYTQSLHVLVLSQRRTLPTTNFHRSLFHMIHVFEMHLLA